MTRSGSGRVAVGAVVVAIGVAAGWGGARLARADAVVERVTRSSGFGGLGAFESETVTITSGTAQREESTVRFANAFLAALQKAAGGAGGVRITRLDRDLVWMLDPEQKIYQETMLTAKGERERRNPVGGAGHSARRDADLEVTKSELKVETTGATRTVNGFPCEEAVMTWVVETRDRKTGDTARSVMTNRLWTTPETSDIQAARREEEAYFRAYLAKLRFEVPPEDVQRTGLATLGGLLGLPEAEQTRVLTQLRAELGKLRGYPVVSDLVWHVEGGGASAPGSAPADLGALLGRLAGGGQAGGPPPPGATPAEKRPAFSLYTEVRSIRSTPADPGRFEVPSGYSQKK